MPAGWLAAAGIGYESGAEDGEEMAKQARKLAGGSAVAHIWRKRSGEIIGAAHPRRHLRHGMRRK